MSAEIDIERDIHNSRTTALGGAIFATMGGTVLGGAIAYEAVEPAQLDPGDRVGFVVLVALNTALFVGGIISSLIASRRANNLELVAAINSHTTSIS